MNRNLLIVLIIGTLVLGLFTTLRMLNSQYPPTYQAYRYLPEGFEQNRFIHMIGMFFSGLYFLAILYLGVRKIGGEMAAFATAAVFALSPLYIFFFSVYTDMVLGFLVMATAVYLLIHDWFMPSAGLFVVSFFLNQLLFFPVLLTLLAYYGYYKKKPLLSALGIVFFTGVFINVRASGFPLETSLVSLSERYISDLGAVYGVSVFALILGGIGALVSWQRKGNYVLIYLLGAVLAFSSLYDRIPFFMLQILIAYLGGLGMVALMRSRWESDTLKNYVLLLMVCGLIFSTGSYINRISQAGPYYSEVLSLRWLADQPDAGVLSAYKYGEMIEYYSGKEPYVDNYYFEQSISKSRFYETEEIFGSRDTAEIIEFLERNNIGYIWVTPEMRSGLVWEAENEGIRLILKNSQSFRLAYSYLGVEVWKFEQAPLT